MKEPATPHLKRKILLIRGGGMLMEISICGGGRVLRGEKRQRRNYSEKNAYVLAKMAVGKKGSAPPGRKNEHVTWKFQKKS